MSAEAPKAIYVSSDISDCSDEIWAEVIKYDQSDIKYVRADIADELIKKLQRFEQMLAVGNPKIDGVSAARFRKEVQDAIAKAKEATT